MLTAIVLELRPVAEGSIPLSHYGMAYAAALDLCSRVDRQFTESLHDDTQKKGLTVSPLGGPFEQEGMELRVTPNATYTWRLTGLTAPIARHLLELSLELGEVRVGETHFRIAAVKTRVEEHPEAGRASYKTLQARWGEGPPVESLQLRFLTPTTFRFTRGDGKKYEHPIPWPRWVFGSLLAKWNAFAPTPLEIDKDLIGNAVVLSNWRGGTRHLKWVERHTDKQGKERWETVQAVGFCGDFTYWIHDSSPEFRRMIGMLAEFAFYAGVGWQTTHGLGQARFERGRVLR